MNVGEFSSKAISFDFDFHHVRSIQVGPVEICQSGFCTRQIALIGADGHELIITAYSDTGQYEMPLVEGGEE